MKLANSANFNADLDHSERLNYVPLRKTNLSHSDSFANLESPRIDNLNRSTRNLLQDKHEFRHP